MSYPQESDGDYEIMSKLESVFKGYRHKTNMLYAWEQFLTHLVEVKRIAHIDLKKVYEDGLISHIEYQRLKDRLNEKNIMLNMTEKNSIVLHKDND